MSASSGSALYNGVVVHKRVRPIEHALRYRVFSLLLDCDGLPELARRLRLFSYNRFNVLSVHDGDHGDGRPLPDYLRAVAAKSGETDVDRFLMLCYPRVLGYGFNPLTVYFGMGRDGRPRLIIYEVNNTFGERNAYVIPVDKGSSVKTVSQSCRKVLYVSPFNSVDGRYRFHLTPPGAEVTIGVALNNDEGPILKAYFRGTRSELSDRTLLSALLRNGWLSVKVISAIHLEALKLRLKGLRIVKRPPAPRAAVTFNSPPREHPHS